MPADPHPFLHPDPAVAQAARDKAKPMAPREGEYPMHRFGEVWRTPATTIDVEAWEGSGVFGDGAIEYDIIAAVDPVTGAVIRTADGVVADEGAAWTQEGNDILRVHRRGQFAIYDDKYGRQPWMIVDGDPRVYWGATVDRLKALADEPENATGIFAKAAPPASTGAVKALVWFEEQKYRKGGVYTADAYRIRYIEGLFLLDFAGNGRPEWRWVDLESAKAAAQADYTARILSALPDGARVVTAEHLLEWAQEWECTLKLRKGMSALEVFYREDLRHIAAMRRIAEGK